MTEAPTHAVPQTHWINGTIPAAIPPGMEHAILVLTNESPSVFVDTLASIGPPPSFGPVAVRVVGFQLMGALPSVVDRCEVSER
ncbi:hypothetical protein MHK74_14100 [Microbacterium aurum]|uniref:hypothetical protein n=1 Tax=Microbacterium aurum TaxID=36805 RepID=UPI001EF70D6C|nr:hypothetical protein [Microbacterium aurum]MCG7415677.1 hypothetical protein [Microbacterium aurum]